jgi:cell fate regulator YaaT (PSP1 superfamily)
MNLQTVEVRFDYLNKEFLFEAVEIDVALGEAVVVETDFGLDIGMLTGGLMERDVPNDSLPLKKALRKASEEDFAKQKEVEEKEQNALDVCIEEIGKAELPMKLVKARYAFDSSKVSFCYTAENRVDFRELVKTLAARLRTRIELRQVGVRDEARLFGGIGPCGKSLCCASFLHEFQSVSIKMAKDQGLPLNPMKISGICGRLFCCLKYEHETYLRMKRALPSYGSDFDREGVKGRVVAVNVLRHSVEVETPDGGRAWVELPEPDPVSMCKICAEAEPVEDEVIPLDVEGELPVKE